MNSHLILKNRIKEMRIQRGWSQSKLADLIGSTQNTISSLETGQYSPTAYLAALIIDAFNCKFEECFYIIKDHDNQKGINK